MKPLTVCIGVDPKEFVTFHVLAHSIMARASGPVRIVPIYLPTLRNFYTRQRDPRQSTEFTFSRFLTPYLAEPNEVSIFLDSDMLCLADVYELKDIAHRCPYRDVLVVKHDYTPKPEAKFLGQTQTSYPCKNWSSVMVFNGWRWPVKKLTPDQVETLTPMFLHQFKWAVDVGELPPEWNHLVGEYEPNRNAKIVHYTLGAPCFRSYQNCEYSEEWFEELSRMTHCDDPILERFDANLPGRGTARGAGLLEPDGSKSGD